MFSPEALLCEKDNLYRFALRLTRNQSEADDLLQSTLLRALEKKEYFQEGTNLFSWTSKIMFNIFAGQYRRKKKFETQYDPLHYIEKVSIVPSQEEAVDLSKVRECMGKLSKEHREILVMVCIRGLRYEEVSEALQIPIGTVRSRLFRARNQLQGMLESPQRAPKRLPAYASHQALQDARLAQSSQTIV